MSAIIPEFSLNILRTSYANGLMDTGVILTYSASTDNYGHGYPTYAEGDTVSCLFRPARRNEVLGNAQIEDIEAICYLPRTQTISNLDRFRVTKLHGETVTNRVYEIVGGPVTDQVLQKVALRLVTDGTDTSSVVSTG